MVDWSKDPQRFIKAEIGIFRRLFRGVEKSKLGDFITNGGGRLKELIHTVKNKEDLVRAVNVVSDWNQFGSTTTVYRFKDFMLRTIKSPLSKLFLAAAVGVVSANVTTSLVTSGFQGLIAVGKTIDKINHHMESLEMGGSLGPGFISSDAATERQRMVSAMNNSVATGRRNLGKEAQLYG